MFLPCIYVAFHTPFSTTGCHFLPMRRYASVVLAVIMRPSVRLSQVGVILKWLNLGSGKQHHTIAQGLWFSGPKMLAKFQRGHAQRGAK